MMGTTTTQVSMSKEIELWGDLREEQFKKFLKLLKKTFGKPIIRKRLAIKMVSDTKHKVDTRIKITDGKPEAVQKLGDWDSPTREEITIQLSNNLDALMNIYTVIKNLLPEESRILNIIQVEEYIFDTKQIEIKLAHQIGNKDGYFVELESKSNNAELEEFAKKYEIETKKGKERRAVLDRWNKEINMNGNEMSDKDILMLFIEYLASK